MKKFREEDLILYLYKECSPAMKKAVDEALEGGDIELTERIKILQRSMRQLNKLKLHSPSPFSVRAVMNYARGEVNRKH